MSNTISTLKDNNLAIIVKDNVNLLRELDNTIELVFTSPEDDIFLNSDSEQLSRVIFNLIKNSIESIQEKKLNIVNYKGKIEIELMNNDTYIELMVKDNGVGFEMFKDNIKDILNPYFTTKKKGTGLGLAIVNKIINDHHGSIDFIPIEFGAKIHIRFIK